MNKSSKPFEAQDDDVERRKKLQFKKKKTRSREPRINFKNIKSITDLTLLLLTGKLVAIYPQEPWYGLTLILIGQVFQE